MTAATRRAFAVLGVVVVLGLVAVACDTPDLAGPVVQPPATIAPEEPTAVSEVGPTAVPVPGLSGSTIRVGVIIDGDPGGSIPTGGLAAWQAMRAWEHMVNDAGGLAGRDVEVVRINANLFDHAAAIAEACDEEELFALVGSYALYDGDGVEILNDVSCRLPDFPAAALNPARRESGVTFVSNPVANDLWQAGPAQLLAERLPAASRSAGTLVVDLPVDFFRAEREIEAAEEAGFNFVYQPTVELSEDYLPHAESMLTAGVDGITWSGDGDRLLDLLEAWERARPGSRPTFVHCSASCYSRDWLQRAGELAEGVWVSINMLPFQDSETNTELLRYLLNLSEVHPDAEPNLVGLWAWAAARLFEATVNGAMFSSGGGLDQRLVIESARNITSWDGRGLHGPANPAEGGPSSCFVMLSVQNGNWIRRHPLTQGEMDCEPENLIQLTSSATLGLTRTPSNVS